MQMSWSSQRRRQRRPDNRFAKNVEDADGRTDGRTDGRGRGLGIQPTMKGPAMSKSAKQIGGGGGLPRFSMMPFVRYTSYQAFVGPRPDFHPSIHPFPFSRSFELLLNSLNAWPATGLLAPSLSHGPWMASGRKSKER